MLAIHCGHNGVLNGKEFAFVGKVVEEVSREADEVRRMEKSNGLNESNEFYDVIESNGLNELNGLNGLNGLNDPTDSTDSTESMESMESTDWKKAVKRRSSAARDDSSSIEMQSMSKDEDSFAVE